MEKKSIIVPVVSWHVIARVDRPLVIRACWILELHENGGKLGACVDFFPVCMYYIILSSTCEIPGWILPSIFELYL